MDSRRKSDGLRAASIDDMFRTIEQLQGVPLVASALERTMLKARLSGYRPALLDELCASGELVWCGAGPLGSNDGWISFALADHADLLLPAPVEADLSTEAARDSRRTRNERSVVLQADRRGHGLDG